MRQRDDLIFSMGEYVRRLALVREELERRELDALLLTTPENISYLTGYQTSGIFYLQALVVPLEGEPFMVTRLLEDSNVQARTWIEESRPYADSESAVTALRFSLLEFGLAGARIGFEKHSYFFRASEQELLLASTQECTFVDCSGLVEQLRLVKSDEEIAVMRRAAQATEAGMLAGLAAVTPGASENDVAAEIHFAMIKAGSEYPTLSPYVASGWRGALGHAHWERRTIEGDEVVFVEAGGCVHRYHTAMMRTVWTGRSPPEKLRLAEQLVQEAVRVSMELIRPGVAAGDVDIQNRYILSRYPHGGAKQTRSGYSIGIAFAPEWGEGQTFSIEAGERRFFEKNMCFHLIPWLQVPGFGGIGLSETIRVTDDGCESFFSRVHRRVFTLE